MATSTDWIYWWSQWLGPQKRIKKEKKGKDDVSVGTWIPKPPQPGIPPDHIATCRAESGYEAGGAKLAVEFETSTTGSWPTRGGEGVR